MSTFRLNDEPTQVEKAVAEDKAAVKAAAATPTEAEQKEQDEKGGKIKEIYLKAPFSHAVTEVLNMLLSKKDNPSRELRQESLVQALQAKVLGDPEDFDESMPDANKGYVYVIDGQRIMMDELPEAMIELEALHEAKEQPGFKAVIFDNSEKILENSSKSATLNVAVQRMEQIGVKVYFNVEAGLKDLTNFIRS